MQVRRQGVRESGITESGILGGRQMVREEWRQEGRYALSRQGVRGGKAAEGEDLGRSGEGLLAVCRTREEAILAGGGRGV